MKNCRECHSFVPPRAMACPNCGAPLSLRWRLTDAFASSWLGSRLALILGSGGFSVVLMACYGMPPCDDLVDRDGDGFFVCEDGGLTYGQTDCDDSDPSVPADADGDGFFTCGDEFSDDCDDSDPELTYARDNDGDGVYSCGDVPSERYPDCDDSDADIRPGALDLDRDGVDQNCDGMDGPA